MSFNTVLTQILTSLEHGLWRRFMRRTGVRVSKCWNFIIHRIFSEFSQPLRDFRTQRVALFPLGFLFICICDLIGLINIRSPRSFINRSWHRYWRDVTLSLILSFSSLGFTYCRWRRRAGRRWWAMIFLSWKCPWSCVFYSPPDSQRGFAPFVSPGESWSLRFQSFVTWLVTFVTSDNGLPRSILTLWRRRQTGRQAFSFRVIDSSSVGVEERLTYKGVVEVQVFGEPFARLRTPELNST